MRSCRTLTTAVLLFSLLAISAARPAGADETDEKKQPAAAKGLDARLTSYPYPYPVGVLGLEAQRQRLEMAYMDVRPKARSGGTVLLLHGKNFSGAYWGSTIAALVERGYRVVVPDQIGFGKSSKPEHFQFSFQALATHTRQLLNALGVEKATVVGHSMGGMVATRFALMFPERVERLVLVNPIGLEDWQRQVPYKPVDAWYAEELAKTPEKVQAYMQESYFGGDWREEYEPLIEVQAGWTQGPDHPLTAWVSALTYDMIFTQPVVHEFADVAVPTLLIIGQRDRTALGKDAVDPAVAKTLGNYPELGKRAAAAIPGARLVELDGVGHVPQYEAFDAYLRALTDFLAAAP